MAHLKRTFIFTQKIPKCISPSFEEAKRYQHANNARVLNVELCKGQGIHVWDKNGKEYLDFIGAQGSLPFGHCPGKVLSAVHEQMCLLHQTTRGVNHNLLAEFSSNLCQLFNYDKVVILSSGAEVAELAIKLSRLWGYRVKKICPKEAVVVFCNGNYWGCSLGAVSASSEPHLFRGFEPLLNGFKLIPYNDACSLEEILRNPSVCGFMTETIQGESGVVVPSEGYLAEVRRLCTQYKVLWIGDEVITGLGRTGAMLGVDHECVKPDILCIGRSLGGGVIPASACLASCEVMDLLTPGVHNSTYAGNPLACKAGIVTLKLIKEEGVIENASAMGALLRDGLLCSLSKDDMPVLRGKGLIVGFKIDPRIGSPCDITENLRDCGLLVWPCKDELMRLTPPLTVTEDEVTQAVGIIKKVVDHMKGQQPS